VPCRATLEHDQVWPVLLRYWSSAPRLPVPPRRRVLHSRRSISSLSTPPCACLLVNAALNDGRYLKSRLVWFPGLPVSSIMIKHPRRGRHTTGIAAQHRIYKPRLPRTEHQVVGMHEHCYIQAFVVDLSCRAIPGIRWKCSFRQRGWPGQPARATSIRACVCGCC